MKERDVTRLVEIGLVMGGEEKKLEQEKRAKEKEKADEKRGRKRKD